MQFPVWTGDQTQQRTVLSPHPAGWAQDHVPPREGTSGWQDVIVELGHRERVRAEAVAFGGSMIQWFPKKRFETLLNYVFVSWSKTFHSVEFIGICLFGYILNKTVLRGYLNNWYGWIKMWCFCPWELRVDCLEINQSSDMPALWVIHTVCLGLIRNESAHFFIHSFTPQRLSQGSPCGHHRPGHGEGNTHVSLTAWPTQISRREASKEIIENV